MENSKLIATIDIGSSKIVAAAGKKDLHKIISVVAIEKEDSENSVRRGCVYNVDETSKKIGSLIQKLNHKLKDKIEKIYVGTGGQSLRTEVYSVVEEGAESMLVTHRILDSLKEKCLAYVPEFADILDIVSPEYFLDGKSETNPIGVNCKKIEVKYQLILGRPSIKRNLYNCITEKNNIKIAGYIISPLATAQVVLTDSEKNLGCVLVEFGAGVTYLSIYKSGLLKYMVTIPLGGNVITRDICDLNILEKDAEDLKIKYGSALVDAGNDENASPAAIKISNSSYNSMEIDVEKLNDIIEARANEIIANIIHQIDISSFSNSLGSGIVITGGGACLKNLAESIEQQAKQKVRIAYVREDLLDEKSYEYGKIPGNEVTFGLLDLGTENCLKAKTEVKQPTTSVHSQGNLFGEIEPPVQKEKEKTGQTAVQKENPVVKPTQPPVQTPKRGNIFKKIFEQGAKSLFDDEDNH